MTDDGMYSDLPWWWCEIALPTIALNPWSGPLIAGLLQVGPPDMEYWT